MKDYGLVSIIMPNYYGERYIAAAIESVVAQTYTHGELLIQDDMSTDDSIEIALRYAENDKRIKVQRNEIHSGAALTRNKAIQRSNGNFLAFLDSDDLWLPEKLEKQLRFMDENACDFAYTAYEEIAFDGTPLLTKITVKRNLSYQDMLFQNWPGCLTVMYRQDVEHKIYGEDVPSNNDRALFLKVLRQTNNAMGMDDCLALYRRRQGSISRNKVKMVKNVVKVIHKFEGHSLVKTWICMIHQFFVKIFFKRKRIQKENSYAIKYQGNEYIINNI